MEIPQPTYKYKSAAITSYFADSIQITVTDFL